MSDLVNSSTKNTLLLDVGNSRMKYAIKVSGAPLLAKHCKDIEDIPELNNAIDKVVLGSVKNNELTQKTILACQQRGIEVVEVTTQSSEFEICCAYVHPENLGVDRWLAILAARLHTQLPVAVIDAGTALTCDLVVENRHLGGWIVPGFSMMREAVTSKADRVFGDSLRPTQLRLGTSTQECVNMGCLAALSGIVNEAHRLLSTHNQHYCIYICGGDSDLLASQVDHNVIIKPNLVLEGLGRFA
ncbi:type III pantothenate kinase [Aliiglaciecola litoralis]|uniref:Type III pantothenate kinase n=1 Tax=Aliiglaciecola litoralis TaxID=582857 RepID=A0ABP3X3M0_9ALTE